MTKTTDLVVLKVKRPDDALLRSSEAMLEAARAQEITTPEMAISASQGLKAVKALAKQIEEKRIAITGPPNPAMKEGNALFKPANEWLGDSATVLKGELLS